MRREIQSVFKVKLSEVTLRPLVGQLKRGEGLPRSESEAGASALSPALEKAEAAEGEATTASTVPDREQTVAHAQALS